MSAHTPGPWTFSQATAGFRAPDEGDFQIVASNLICPGTVWGGSGFKEGEANARLIAAAPALLLACKAIVQMDSSPMGTMYELPRAISEARSAIAKAEQPLTST